MDEEEASNEYKLRQIKKKWTKEEDEALTKLMEQFKGKGFRLISE